MASQSQGIQQLLHAEKRAAEKVAEARKPTVLVSGKARRLRQAKEEAQGEIEQYRLEREKDFRHKQEAVMGSQGNLAAEVEQQTRQKIQAMQANHHRNKEKVLRQLLMLVCDIKPEIHHNYRFNI
ncbi:V-type proton ATPase subunit G 2-like isoform X1 [Heptranchias perlo]|uniref:V-type proton ATPase subunit G 2-like isoform X1 n=1 Tax=Heptranchias perlo TaxID=212740 RepID=UPI00355A3014